MVSYAGCCAKDVCSVVAGIDLLTAFRIEMFLTFYGNQPIWSKKSKNDHKVNLQPKFIGSDLHERDIHVFDDESICY